MVLEIGFGQSSFIKNYADSNPENLVVGVEVRKRAVQVMQEKLLASPTPNIHLVHGNGTACLEQMFPDACLDAIFIFHPDPWRKHRHQKRRVISAEFLTVATQKLKDGGRIHVSTDVAFLWDDIKESFNAQPSFTLINDDAFWQTYSTRWHEIAQEKQRETFYATYAQKKLC
jgi:tRNA (guanine-N7-)-methyltransferase